jgi:hypothetical protein
MMNIKQAKINECLNLVRLGNRKLNEIRLGKNETKEHRNKKQEICMNLFYKNIPFMTETIFKTGGRADILILEEFKIIEVQHSESDESIENKKLTYPKGLKIEVVKV